MCVCVAGSGKQRKHCERDFYVASRQRPRIIFVSAIGPYLVTLVNHLSQFSERNATKVGEYANAERNMSRNTHNGAKTNLYDGCVRAK